MTTLVAILVAAVIGVALAIGSSVAVVQVATSKPDPVTRPVVVYGNN